MVTKNSVRYIQAYKMFEKRYLPNSGGWLDQGAKFISAMNVIEGELNKNAD